MSERRETPRVGRVAYSHSFPATPIIRLELEATDVMVVARALEDLGDSEGDAELIGRARAIAAYVRLEQQKARRSGGENASQLRR